jgi:hypothetical protein
MAKAKADLEYERYHALQDAKPRAIDTAFERIAKQFDKAPTRRRSSRRKKDE